MVTQRDWKYAAVSVRVRDFPCLGIGLLPVMLSGLLVFAASFVMQLIF